MKRLFVAAFVLAAMFATTAWSGQSVADFKLVKLKFSTMNPKGHCSIDSVYRIKDAIEEKN